MVPTGLVLFYTHFCLSRVLPAGLLCPDPLYRWYFTVSGLMRRPLFFSFSVFIVALAAMREDKGMYPIQGGRLV